MRYGASNTARLPSAARPTVKAATQRIWAPARNNSPKPVATSTVKCRYTGKLVDGKVFDSTANRGNEPAEFGLNQVIPAWTEGVQKIGKGGKIVIYAPAALGYGKEGPGPIPGESVLAFEVELVEFT